MICERDHQNNLLNTFWLSMPESSKIIHCGIIFNVPSCYNRYQASYLYNNRPLKKYFRWKVEQHDIDQEITSQYNQLRVWRYQRPVILGKTLIVTTHSVKKHKVQWHMRMTQVEHKANLAHIHKTTGNIKLKLKMSIQRLAEWCVIPKTVKKMWCLSNKLEVI